MTPGGYHVVTEGGYVALFKDRAKAEQYAASSRGVFGPLYTHTEVMRLLDDAYNRGLAALPRE